MLRQAFLIVSAAVLLVAGACAALADLPPVPDAHAERIRDAAPVEPTVKPAAPRRVLIWNTPFIDDCPHKFSLGQSTLAFEALGKKSGAYESSVSDDPAVYLPERLREFDAIVFNNSNGPWIRPTEEAMAEIRRVRPDLDTIDAAESALRDSLMNFIREGGGVVAFHHAIGGNPQWPEFNQQVIGAQYHGHPWNEVVTVKIDAADHPLMAAFGGESFQIHEEIFQFREPYSRENCHVLMSLDTAATNMDVPHIHRTDGDFALAWIRSFGRGRVFYTAIGHRAEHFWDPRVLRFYLDGIQFVCRDLLPDAQDLPGSDPRDSETD